MTKETRRLGPLTSFAVAVAVLVTGVALAAGTAAARTSQASAYRLMATLTPGQVVPAVQAPASAMGHFHGILLQGGSFTSLSAARAAGCAVAPPSNPRTGRPNQARCLGTIANVPSSPTQWRLFWRLTVFGLSGPATNSALHLAPTGHAAAPLMALCAPCHTISHGVKMLSADQVDALVNNAAYVDVATAAHPNGEIRGQIVKGSVLGAQK